MKYACTMQWVLEKVPESTVYLALPYTTISFLTQRSIFMPCSTIICTSLLLCLGRDWKKIHLLGSQPAVPCIDYNCSPNFRRM